MKEDIALKTGLTGLGVVVVHYVENLTPLVWLLVLFETLDYLSGIIAAARKKGGIDRETAFWGFIKKLCYFILIGVGFGVDYIITDAKNMMGLELNYPAVFGILSVCYLLSTEAISIMENLAEQDIEVPFLSKFLKKFREKISDDGEKSDK